LTLYRLIKLDIAGKWFTVFIIVLMWYTNTDHIKAVFSLLIMYLPSATMDCETNGGWGGLSILSPGLFAREVRLVSTQTIAGNILI